MQALKLVPYASCEKDTAGHGPRKTEKRYLGSTLLDLEGGMVSGGLLKSLMIGEFPSLSGPVAQLASQLSLLLVRPF